MIEKTGLITEFFHKYRFDDVDAYKALGGFKGLENAITKGKDFVLESLKISDIRGRGGAEFPAWKKWDSAQSHHAAEKIILCNADEGEPGSFKDRDILLYDPMKVIEGMLIAAYTIGAERGYIYIREEYAHIRKKFETACEKVKEAGLLGKNIMFAGFNFDIHVNTGAGAYICGENSALIESMHGRVGKPRLKFPRVGEKGLFGLPTMVNNVETFVCAATVLIHGADRYCETGTAQSKGNKIISLSGKITRPGTYEVPFGIRLKDILYDLGGGGENNIPIKFVQTGGASGPLIPPDFFDLDYTYEAFEKNGFSIGAGSIMVVPKTMALIDYLIAIEEFFKHESCGKCTPCREGLGQIVKLLHKIKNKTAVGADLDKLKRVADVMVSASFCGLGTSAPTALFSAFKYFEAELYENVIDRGPAHDTN